MKRIVFDIDGTLCETPDGNYSNSVPKKDIIDCLVAYREKGYEIVLSTSRNMRTYSGNVGKINANTLPILIEWLTKHNVPYDEIYVGKPWCGQEGFYVDDKAIRPDELVGLTEAEIRHLVGLE